MTMTHQYISIIFKSNSDSVFVSLQHVRPPASCLESAPLPTSAAHSPGTYVGAYMSFSVSELDV
jgi:hypothetical protein